MARLTRWLFYLIGLFILFVVLGYAAAQFYKPKILETLNRELQNGINGDFQIGGLDFTIFEQFPNFSITLSDIYLRGPKYSAYHEDFFTAEKIYVHVQPLHLFRGSVDLKSITVRNGRIFVFRTAEGYTNLDVIKKNNTDSTKKNDSSLSLDLGNILFENTRFTYADSLKKKSFDVKFIKTTADLTSSDSSRSISLNGPIWFGGLEFNHENGGFLSNTQSDAKLNLEFVNGKQQLMIHPSELKFAKSTVALSGQFDLASPGGFTLNIASKEIDYAEGLTLVTRALSGKLSKFQFDKPIDLSLRLVGKLTPGDKPRVNITFSTSECHFTSGKIEMSDLSFTGTFNNQLDSTKLFDDHNTRISLEIVSAKVADIPLIGRLIITDLTDAQLIVDTRSEIDLTELNHHTDTTKIKFLSGFFSSVVRYEGTLKEYLDANHTGYRGKLQGTVNVTDASVYMQQQQRRFDQATLQVHFTEKRMDLDKVNFLINGNSIRLKGNVKGFVPFFFQPEKKGYVNLSLYSPRIDLSTLVKKKTKRSANKELKDRKKISDLMEALYDKVEFDLDIKADEIVNGPFRANQLSGKLSLIKDRFSAGPVKMKLADGDVALSLKISKLNEPLNPVILTAEVREADIKKFFSSFNNFSQSTIKSDHLSGKVSALMQLNATIDDEYNIQMPSLVGDVDFKIKDGKLMDFEPLQSMSNFLFKKRDFTDVQFAEIDCQFRLSGTSLNISRMEIESSVLSLFLEGRYSLKDSTDLSIQVPLSNLKRRDKTYRPENVGVDAKVGPSIFLKAFYKDGKTVIKYDPFKKFKSKKK